MATKTRQSTLAIGEVALLAGLRTSAIRYYERRGLLPPAGRVNGIRRYDDSVLPRLAVIDLAKQAGFTLDEIEQLLAHSVKSGVQWRRLAEAKLQEVDALIARAEVMRTTLHRSLECGCLELAECEAFAAQVDRRVAQAADRAS